MHNQKRWKHLRQMLVVILAAALCLDSGVTFSGNVKAEEFFSEDTEMVTSSAISDEMLPDETEAELDASVTVEEKEIQEDDLTDDMDEVQTGEAEETEDTEEAENADSESDEIEMNEEEEAILSEEASEIGEAASISLMSENATGIDASKAVSKQTSVTITGLLPDQEYRLYDSQKREISYRPWESGAAGSITYKRLVPDTLYYVAARKTGETELSEMTAVTTLPETPAEIPYTYLSKTAKTIKLFPATEDNQEYKILDAAGNDISGQGWVKAKSHTVTWTGLTPETKYKIVTRRSGTYQYSEIPEATSIITDAQCVVNVRGYLKENKAVIFGKLGSDATSVGEKVTVWVRLDKGSVSQAIGEYTGKNGAFKIVFSLPDTLAAGSHKITVSAKESMNNSDFYSFRKQNSNYVFLSKKKQSGGQVVSSTKKSVTIASTLKIQQYALTDGNGNYYNLKGNTFDEPYWINGKNGKALTWKGLKSDKKYYLQTRRRGESNILPSSPSSKLKITTKKSTTVKKSGAFHAESISASQSVSVTNKKTDSSKTKTAEKTSSKKKNTAVQSSTSTVKSKTSSTSKTVSKATADKTSSKKVSTAVQSAASTVKSKTSSTSKTVSKTDSSSVSVKKDVLNAEVLAVNADQKDSEKNVLVEIDKKLENAAEKSNLSSDKILPTPEYVVEKNDSKGLEVTKDVKKTEKKASTVSNYTLVSSAEDRVVSRVENKTDITTASLDEDVQEADLDETAQEEINAGIGSMNDDGSTTAPKTGDYSNPFSLILTLGLSVLLFFAGVLSFFKRKEEI